MQSIKKFSLLFLLLFILICGYSVGQIKREHNNLHKAISIIPTKVKAIDSLPAINHSDGFFEKLTAGEATFLSSIISAIIAIVAIFLSKYFQNKKYEHEKYDAVKKYANPIIFAAEQLAWRLKEILNFNGAYLLPNAPQNGFFKYKFDSTVYRLCALLGWIQAAKKEQSYIEGIKIKQHGKVQAVISKLHKLLADGSHLEVSILNELSQLFDIKLDLFKETERTHLGAELEKIVFGYIPDSVKKNVVILDQAKQIEMLKEILDFICEKAIQPKVKIDVIRKKRILAINEVSREYCWIYRDWQSAIGDEMIEIIENANRRFDVIGFAQFQLKHDNNEWLKKVDNLFSNLDVSIDDRFDTRVNQLKQVFEALLELIETFKVLVKKQETISDASLKGLKEFNSKINISANKKIKKKLRLSISYQ